MLLLSFLPLLFGDTQLSNSVSMKFFQGSKAPEDEDVYQMIRRYLEHAGYSVYDIECTAPLILEILYSENDFRHDKDKVFYPFYQGMGFPAAFLMEIYRAFHTKFHAGKEASPMRLFPSGPETLDDFFQDADIQKILKQDPQVTPMKMMPSMSLPFFDHSPKVTPHIASVNPTLFQKKQEESVLYFFAMQKNVTLDPHILRSKILEPAFEQFCIPKDRAWRYMHVYHGYKGKITRALLQIFIRQDKINDIVYVSKKMGVPFNLNLKKMQFFRDTHNLLMHMREGYEGIENYFKKYPQHKGTEIYNELVGNRHYWQDALQLRILASSTLFWKRSICSSKIFYEHNVRPYVEQMRKDIDVLVAEDAKYCADRWIQEKQKLSSRN